VGIKGTVLFRVLITAAGAKLGDSLDTNVQGLQLLPDDALSHSLAKVLYQQPHATLLRQRESVKTHTFLAKGPQRADSGSEVIGG
jgi:hypothetical protein